MNDRRLEWLKREQEITHKQECAKCRGEDTPLPCTQDPSYDNAFLRYTSGLPLVPVKTLDGYIPQTPLQEEALKKAKQFAEKPEGWLVFFGPPGTGKTHLCLGIAEELLKKKVPVRYYSIVRLLDALRAEVERNNEPAMSKQIAWANRTWVVILDDLGAERLTPFAEERIEYIIDSRYHHALPTVITTNLNYESMSEHYHSERIASRVFGFNEPFIIGAPLDGPDWRTRGVRRGQWQGKEKTLLGL